MASVFGACTMHPVAYAGVGSNAPIACGCSVFGPCFLFNTEKLVSFLILQ